MNRVIWGALPSPKNDIPKYSQVIIQSKLAEPRCLALLRPNDNRSFEMLQPCKDPLSLLVLHVPGQGGWRSRQTRLEGEIFLDFLQVFLMGRLHVADAQN